MADEMIEKDMISVKRLLNRVFGTDSYTDIRRMGGLTNHTYRVTLNSGEDYVVRIPGEGTEELINRADEKVSTLLACRIGIDAQLLYFGEDGSKVTRFISDAETLSMDTMRREENLVKAAKVLRRLHTCGENTGVPFRVFDMAAAYEKIIKDNSVALYEDYLRIKSRIMQIKERVDRNGEAETVPCHNDPLCENWVLSAGEQLYLIDWEYAGMNDGMWDLADISIEAAFTREHDELLLESYFGRKPTQGERERFRANKLYLDYLWTLWGKARVPFDGDSMEQYALERYIRLKKNLDLFE